MKPMRFALFGAVAALAAVPALAQPGPGGPGRGAGRGAEAVFTQVDADRDGRVTWEEGWGFVQQRFTQADANRDGALSQEEARNLRFGQGRRAAAGERGAARPGGATPEQRAAWGERHARFAGMMFRGLDANRDSRVTLEEIQPFAQARFRALDANADNAVTREELPQRQGRRGRGPARQGQAQDQGQGGAAPQGGQPAR